MIDRPYLVSMARYNSWMNGKVYDAAEKLPRDEIARDRGAFFKSILGTLNHLLAADLAWFGRFKDGAPRASNVTEILHADLSELRQARQALDREIEAWVAEVDEAWLAQPFTYTSLLGGVRNTYPAWQLVTHMFNHQTHHRGQITTLLTQRGIDVGATDFIVLPGLREMV